MDQKHTPEPLWVQALNAEYSDSFQVMRGNKVMADCSSHTAAHEIADTLNSLAGIEDVDEFMNELKKRLILIHKTSKEIEEDDEPRDHISARDFITGQSEKALALFPKKEN